jgi:hypothetical protein
MVYKTAAQLTKKLIVGKEIPSETTTPSSSFLL